MAKVAIVDNSSGSALVKTGNGTLWNVNISKVATGTSPGVTLYDNTSASGTKLFDGDGLTQESFAQNDGNGGGIPFSNGLYCAVAGGTTKATVVVIYD